MRPIALLLGLLLLADRSTLAQDMTELDLDHSVNSQFATPHTDWATPYALGTTRVLFFVNGRGTGAREVIELKQRFDFDPQMVFWARVVDTTRDEWHGAENGVRRMARLLTEKWDVFVFMGVSPEKMPVEEQYPMLKAVTEGAGLVLFGTDDKRVLKDKNRLEERPALLDDVDGAAAFSIQRGRGVRLPQAPAIDYGPGWTVAYDQWDMRVGKAILWAAGKEPKLNLVLTPTAKDLARTTLPGTAATLAWQGADAGTVAEVITRRQDGTAVATRMQPLGTPTGNAPLDLPLVRADRYWFDVIARVDKTVVGFASMPFTVTCPRRVDEIRFAQDWAEVGERLSGQVALSGAPGAGERLSVSLLDRRGRELARQILTPGAGVESFGFDVQAWFPMLLEVRATLLDGPQEVASAWRFARVIKRHRGQFNFVMWDRPSGNLAPVAEASLARSGVTIQLGSGTPPPVLAAYDIAWIPYTTHVDAKRDEKGVTKPACWWDGPAIQAHVDKIVASYAPSRQHGVFVYSLGDEIDVRGSCLGPHCLEAYRQYLQDQYKDIAALNASWGSTYTSFGQVELGKPDDNDEAESLRTGNSPRWFDRQAFQSYSFCKLCERFGDGFRRIDPQSRCGFEGAGTFAAADDLDGFVRSNTFWSPYPGTADEVLRSIAPRDFPRSNWMGYTKDADSLLEKYWRMITRGCDSVWWWRWEVFGRFHGWLAPTLDPYPAVQEILRDTQVVRDGLGDLLLHSEMQTDGIGILYSQPSAYAAKVQTSPSYGSYESNHTAFHNVLRGTGLSFRYFTDRQMRLGEVDLGRFKVIILPMAQALGAQETEQFRQYVRGGGLLIADIRPAVFDGHVKPLAAGQLDDVFGIKRTGRADALTADGRIAVPAAGGGPESVTLTKARVDSGVQAAGASAAGAAGPTPLWLTNPVGQGRAVLLNLAMSSYPAVGSETTPEAAVRLWRVTLGQAQVSPAVGLTDGQGQPLRNVEVTRWTNGPVQIVSIFRHAGASGPAVLELPRPMYAYDLKDRRELGRNQAFELAITPYRARFYALSPDPLKPVALQVAPTAAPGRAQRVLITSALPQGQQAVRIQVTLPDGRVADWGDPVALVDHKGTAAEVPVAFNDPPGKWTVTATDLYTGKTASTQFEVGQ